MACGSARCLTHRASLSRCPRVARRVRRRPAAYRPQGLSIPGRRQFPGRSYIPRRFPQLVLSAPAHRLIRPTALRPIRASKQAGQDGGRSSAVLAPRHRIPAPSRLRPVSPLVSAGRGEERLVPVGSVPSSCSCVPASFAVVKAFQSFLDSVPQPSRQASRQGRPVPVPSLVSAGGRPSANAPRIGSRGPSIDTAGKQAGRRRLIVPSARLDPVPLLLSAS